MSQDPDGPETVGSYWPEREEPQRWWQYEVLRDGVVVPFALQARSGPQQRVRRWWRHPPLHLGETAAAPPGEVLEEGAADGLILWLPAGEVVIRRKGSAAQEWKPPEAPESLRCAPTAALPLLGDTGSLPPPEAAPRAWPPPPPPGTRARRAPPPPPKTLF